MAITVQNVLDEAAALLNDVPKSMYTDAVMLPFIKKAYRDFQSHLELAGVQTVEHKNSIGIKVTAGETDLDTVPADLFNPVKLWERRFGSSDEWIPMVEQPWEPIERPAECLRYWVWREDALVFLGATIDREVMMLYQKFLTVITGVNSIVSPSDCQTYLASKTASIAALLVGEDETRAAALNDDARVEIDKILAKSAKRQQAMPVRRPSFRRGR